MDLGKVVDKIADYSDLLHVNEFKHTGSGFIAWTNRYRRGDVKIDIGAHSWTVYNVADLPMACGEGPEELKSFLESEEMKWQKA